MAKRTRQEVPPLGELNMGGGSKIDLDELLCREFSDIDEANEILPGMLEWVNMKLQVCIETHKVKQLEAKELEAKAWLDFKGGKLLDERPGISSTEKAIDKAVVLVPEVMEAGRTVAKYAAWVERLRGLQYSITTKLELTRSAEATRRKVFNDPEPIREPKRVSRNGAVEDEDN